MPKSPLTIVSLRSPYPDVSTTPIHPVVVDAVAAACQAQGVQRSQDRHLALLRCYLDVTGRRLMLWQRTASRDRGVAIGFIGALHSPSFFESSPINRYVHSRIWLRAISNLGLASVEDLKPYRPRASHSTKDLLVEHAQVFETLTLDADMVTIWRGWRLPNASGSVCWLAMEKVYLKFGAEWTEQFYKAIAIWYRARKQSQIPGLSEFMEFLVDSPTITAENLRSPAFVSQMWKAYWKAYQEKRKAYVSTYVLLRDWVSWRNFVEDAITSPRLVVKSLTELPGPDSVRQPLFGASEAGPLQSVGLIDMKGLDDCSDTELLDHFLRGTPKALADVDLWADSEVSRIFSNYLESSRARHLGEARTVGPVGVNTGQRWLLDATNPDARINAAATFHKLGFLRERDADLSNLFPTPLRTTALNLALPTRDTILPFAAVLVSEHAEITPSFLEKLELFDKNRKPHCFRKIDGGRYLIGIKDRKGRASAEQRIKLSARAESAVIKLILITRSARAYLERNGDQNWRRLFISTGQGFGHPKPVRFGGIIHEYKRGGRLLDSFYRAGIEKAQADTLSRLFTLKELRTTKGIQVLIDKHSEREAALALGHSEWRPMLIKRYLPERILKIFRARWLRLFQNEVLIVVSPSPEYAMRVTGLESVEALEDFLASTSFSRMKEMLEPSVAIYTDTQQEQSEFIFEANAKTVYAVRMLAESKDEGTASPFWSSFAKYLLFKLEQRGAIDPQIQKLMSGGTS